MHEGDARRDSAIASAAERIAAAADALAAAEAVAHAAAARAPRLLAAARAQLAEARLRHRDGDHLAAEVAAGTAAELALEASGAAASAAARYADAAQLATWRGLRDDAIAWSKRTGRAAVVVNKESHLVTVYVAGRQAAEFDADLGFNWVADKRMAGDGATPEGRYAVQQVKRGGQTRYYKALLLDFPNAADRREFDAARRNREVPPGAGIGGLIEIHGHGGRGADWTDGCIALADADMDRLFRLVTAGAPVTIIGADQPGELARHAESSRPTGGRTP